MESLIAAQAKIDPKYADIIELAKEKGLTMMKFRPLKRYANRDLLPVERAYINDGILKQGQHFTLILIPEEE